MSQSTIPAGIPAADGTKPAIAEPRAAIGDVPIPLPPVALSPTNPSVTTTSPTSSVAVTVPNTSGAVTFSLVVTDNLGVKSPPAYATVTIQSPPVAALTATPETITTGGTIELSGAGSKSSGSIASYTFSLVPAAG